MESALESSWPLGECFHLKATWITILKLNFRKNHNSWTLAHTIIFQLHAHKWYLFTELLQRVYPAIRIYSLNHGSSKLLIDIIKLENKYSINNYLYTYPSPCRPPINSCLENSHMAAALCAMKQLTAITAATHVFKTIHKLYIRIQIINNGEIWRLKIFWLYEQP